MTEEIIPVESKAKTKVGLMLTEAVEATSVELIEEYSTPQVISNQEVRRATLDEIHQRLADNILKVVQNEENLTPQMISAVSKFLSDNNCRLGLITAESPMGNLLKSLPFQVQPYE